MLREERWDKDVPNRLVHRGRLGCRGIRRSEPHLLARQPEAVGQHQAARSGGPHTVLRLGDRHGLQRAWNVEGTGRRLRRRHTLRALYWGVLPDDHPLRPRTGQARCADGVAMGDGWRRA